MHGVWLIVASTRVDCVYRLKKEYAYKANATGLEYPS